MHHMHPNQPSQLLCWDADGVCSLHACTSQEVKPHAEVSHQALLTAASQRRKLPNTVSIVEQQGTCTRMRHSLSPSTSLKKTYN